MTAQTQGLTIRPATRQGVRPLICLYSESGGGKTYSALLLARGFVGPTGKMVMVDTESGRGELYADVPIFGGYSVLSLQEPFSPARYIQAIEAVEQSGASIGIIDSGSHEWEGMGGVLDMAGDNEARTGKAGLHNWKTPKFEHAQFLAKLLRSTIPWIICLRAKFKTRQIREPGKKAEIVKDDHLTPIQAEDFIFEATVHGEITLDHKFIPRKISHPDLAKCVPSGGLITLEHGQLLAQWCAAPGKTAPAAANGTISNKGALLTELRTLTEPIHGWKKGAPADDWTNHGKAALEDWLIAEGIIGDGASLSDFDAVRLSEVISETRQTLLNVGRVA